MEAITKCSTPQGDAHAPLVERALTLEQVIRRLCSGEPISWVTVRDGNEIFDIAIAVVRHGRPS
jgi:hypothetical protein